MYIKIMLLFIGFLANYYIMSLQTLKTQFPLLLRGIHVMRRPQK